MEDVLGPVELEAGLGEGADLAERGEDGGDGGVVEDLGVLDTCHGGESEMVRGCCVTYFVNDIPVVDLGADGD